MEPSPLVACTRRFNARSSTALWLEAFALPAIWIACRFASTRMSHAQSPNSCPEVVRCQPQSASMSTSSEYYRSAHPHSHYQNFPSGAHEQDYADYLRTWQDTSHASYTGPSSVPLNLAHYPQPGLGSDYARPQQPHVQQTWNASYAPPDVQVQQWNACVNEQTFAPRLSAPYDIVEGGASVQHSAPNVARPYPHQHHQQPATATHEQPLTSPDHTFRDTDRFTALRITSVSASIHRRTLTID